MTQENLRDTTPRGVELESTFRRLTFEVNSIASVADAALRIKELPDYARSEVELHAGRAIRELVQDHLRRNLQGPSSVRQFAREHGFDMGIARFCGGLDVDSGLLYDVPRSERTRYTKPADEREWMYNRQAILSQVTCLKYY